MEKVVNITVDALSRFGEKIERHLIPDEYQEEVGLRRSGSASMFPSARSAFSRPPDRRQQKQNVYASKKRELNYGGNGRKHSYDHLAASPANNSFSNYRQTPMNNGGMRQRAIDGTSSYVYPSLGSGFNSYPGFNNGSQLNMPYGAMQGNVGYAPDYYIAERREMELIPAPPPRVIQQQVPVPYAVDRPVPQPYPVAVDRPVYVDRPVGVPVPVPTPFPVDRPVPYPVPVASPTPPPVCVPVPVPVPSPVPCYYPVGVPVPSPPPSPVMIEQSVTHSQRWLTGSPTMMNSRSYVVNSPPAMPNQSNYSYSSPMMNNSASYFANSSNPYASMGNNSFIR